MNYFVVDSAFQMLCAIEARDRLAPGERNILVVEARGAAEGREANRDQILALDDGGWAGVEVLVFPRFRGPRRSATRLMNLARLIARHGRAARVFIGTYSGDWARRTARILGRHMVRIDDGIGSLTIVEDLRRTGGGTGPEPVLFTLFQRDGDGPGIVRNEFATLRASATPGQWRDPGLTWLLGGAYAEAKVLSLADELALFAFLARRHAGTERIYLPHRADAPAKLARIAAMGVAVMPQGLALESRLLREQRLPARVAGVISTVLFTTRRLQPEIVVEAVHIESPARDWLPMAYRLAGEFGITVLEQDPTAPLSPGSAPSA